MPPPPPPPLKAMLIFLACSSRRLRRPLSGGFFTLAAQACFDVAPFLVRRPLVSGDALRYVEVDEDNGAELFYYFVESEAGGENAPLLLWLTGGDHCSVLSGLALEIGIEAGRSPVLNLKDEALAPPPRLVTQEEQRPSKSWSAIFSSPSGMSMRCSSGRPASLRVSRPRRSTLRLQGGADGREEVRLARMANKAVRRAYIEA
ncbi:hypothetical protein QYE76_038977 [Lolium multiflorum]|uniref:Uncharacterized protein n=1 Tax=Lolium multiflorum TaxID=4521 RepID=A0AAD8T8T7_LOLMU|nr:hypothetical protein QYE76_038977 [Lolium multiflorum]